MQYFQAPEAKIFLRINKNKYKLILFHLNRNIFIINFHHRNFVKNRIIIFQIKIPMKDQLIQLKF